MPAAARPTALPLPVAARHRRDGGRPVLMRNGNEYSKGRGALAPAAVGGGFDGRKVDRHHER